MQNPTSDPTSPSDPTTTITTATATEEQTQAAETEMRTIPVAFSQRVDDDGESLQQAVAQNEGSESEESKKKEDPREYHLYYPEDKKHIWRFVLKTIVYIPLLPLIVVIFVLPRMAKRTWKKIGKTIKLKIQAFVAFLKRKRAKLREKRRKKIAKIRALFKRLAGKIDRGKTWFVAKCWEPFRRIVVRRAMFFFTTCFYVVWWPIKITIGVLKFIKNVSERRDSSVEVLVYFHWGGAAKAATFLFLE